MNQNDFENKLNICSISGMIIGNDLDALLSACIIKSCYGFDIIGIYDYQNIWFNSNISRKEFLLKLKYQSYLCVDLDIYRNYLPSIGHHILSLHPDDILPQHEFTINPNLINGITHQNFKQKYPMGTVHFLMYILNQYPTLTRLGEMLIWLADSTFINAQSHRFADNFNFWLVDNSPNRILKNGITEIESVQFEEEMAKSVFPVLQKTGLSQGRGQVKSKILKLQGFQCQWKNPNNKRLNIIKLLELIEQHTTWKKPIVPEKFSVIQGKRHSYKFSKVEEDQPGFLRNFLADKKVFSYVITNRYIINYTTGIDFI